MYSMSKTLVQDYELLSIAPFSCARTTKLWMIDSFTLKKGFLNFLFPYCKSTHVAIKTVLDSVHDSMQPLFTFYICVVVRVFQGSSKISTVGGNKNIFIC